MLTAFNRKNSGVIGVKNSKVAALMSHNPKNNGVNSVEPEKNGVNGVELEK